MRVSQLVLAAASAASLCNAFELPELLEQLPFIGSHDVFLKAAELAFPDSSLEYRKEIAAKYRAVHGDQAGFIPKQISKAKFDREFSLKSFPSHGLRLKDPSSLGIDPGVKQYSGYLDIEEDDKHFFFWAFESRNDPANDPVILWLNGGPGCSSATGEFFELGPSFINAKGEVVYNEYSWNSNATLIFLDQPVNVGYSYSSNRIGSTRAAAEDVYVFLELLFAAFPEYNSGQKFHVAGESYGGHYLPAIGKEILSHEDRSFGLASILLGNPITDLRYQAEAKVAMACGEGGYPAVFESELCSDLYRKLPRCETLVTNCQATESDLVCIGTNMYCGQLAEPYFELNRSTYDISLKCSEEHPCYPEQDRIEEYLNKPEVKAAAGAEVDVFIGCNHNVSLDFTNTGDYAKNFHDDLVYILESGTPILQYSGKLDWTCNILGSRRLLPKLQWSGAYTFNKAYPEEWMVDGKVAGWKKSSGKGASALLTYLEIESAGHMVPHDQPRIAKEMLDQWIFGGSII